MATPDRELRSYIGYAAARLQVGLGQARIISDLQSQFPREDEARLLHALNLATEYHQAAARIRRLMGPRQPGQPIQRGFTVAEFLAQKGEAPTQASVRIFFTGTLQNGREVQGSMVFNVDAGATVQTITARAGAAICGGYVRGPNQTYQCRELHLSFQSVTPYHRGTGIPLDTAPITRAHPNPYPLGREP